MRLRGELTGDDGQRYAFDGSLTPVGHEPPPATTYSGRVSLSGLHVPAGALVELDPATDTVVEVAGNVVVEGTLRMRPHPGVAHTLRFVDVDEASFVGGGMRVMDSDPGLWVVAGGVLDAQGAVRTPWTRATGALRAGDHMLRVEDRTGWQVGDEIVVVPTGSPRADARHFDRYDRRTILAFHGDALHIDPLTHDHPATVRPAEVINLTRNVRIEGTPAGRAHIMFLHGTVAQHLAHVELRHLGPRRRTGVIVKGVEVTASILGRYPVHFHHCGDDSRGSTLTGVVAHDCGNRAFVTHGSHGITLDGCAAHDVTDDPFWWDGMVDTRTTGDPSHDIAWLGCVASRVLAEPTHQGYSLAGFVHGLGEGCRAVGCVAVGVQGHKNSSGYHWPEGPTDSAWEWRDNVAHNCARHGIFTWQNTSKPHLVEGTDAYNCGGSGISHGAYANAYTYRGGRITGCGEAPVIIHAVSADVDPPLTFDGLDLDASGGPHGIDVTKHNPGSHVTRATVVTDCTLRSYTTSAVGFTYAGDNGDTAADRLTVEADLRETHLPVVTFAAPLRDGSRVEINGEVHR